MTSHQHPVPRLTTLEALHPLHLTASWQAPNWALGRLCLVLLRRAASTSVRLLWEQCSYVMLEMSFTRHTLA
jgi:hypothetical protein